MMRSQPGTPSNRGPGPPLPGMPGGGFPGTPGTRAWACDQIEHIGCP